MLELPDYKLPQPKSVLIGLFTRAKMFLQPRRHDDLLHDGAGLVSGLVSARRPRAPQVPRSITAWRR